MPKPKQKHKYKDSIQIFKFVKPKQQVSSSHGSLLNVFIFVGHSFMRSAQVDKLRARDKSFASHAKWWNWTASKGLFTCFLWYVWHAYQAPAPPCAPSPRGISFVWQTWNQTQLISYQSNFSAYASNLHAINLCDKVKCRTVDTGWFKGGSVSGCLPCCFALFAWQL